jgi:peptidoglycan/xylan/chitin deacetylase (PgdA/CDA1 family)
MDHSLNSNNNSNNNSNSNGGDHDQTAAQLTVVDEDATGSPPRTQIFTSIYDMSGGMSPNRIIVDESASVTSASTLGTMFLDAESEEEAILKAELRQLGKDFEEQNKRLMDAESKVREFRDNMLQMQEERDNMKELQEETLREIQLLRNQSGTVQGLNAALKGAIGEIDRLKKLQLKEEGGERDQEMELSRLKVQALNLEVTRLHNEAAEERLDKERIQREMELELLKMMENLSKQTREEFEQRLMDAIEEIERLKAGQTNHKEGNDSGAAPSSSAQERLRQDEISQLQQELSQVRNANGEKEKQLQSELVKLKRELAQVRDSGAEKEQRLQRELLELQIETSQVRDSLEGIKSENERINQEYQAQLDKTVMELSASQEERDRLRSSMSKKGHVPRDDVSKAVAHAVEPRDEQIKELRKQIAQLSQSSKRSIEDQNWSSARLKVYKEESALLQRQLIEQRRDVDHELQLAYADSKNTKAEAERLHQRLERISSENQELKTEVENIQGKLGRSRNQNAQSAASDSFVQVKVTELEAVVETRNEEINSLREQLEGAKGIIAVQGKQLAEAKKEIENHAFLVHEPTPTETASKPVDSVVSAGKDRSGSVDTQQHLDTFEDAVTGSPERVIVESPQGREEEFAIEIPLLEHNEVSPDELDSSERQEKDANLLVELSSTIDKPTDDEVGADQENTLEILTGAEEQGPLEGKEEKPVDESNLDTESVDTPKARGGGDMHELESFEEHVHIWPRSWHDNDGRSKYEGRNVIGYGPRAPKPMWPNMAKVALNFVIHYEEGSEMCLLHGDSASESQLTEIVGAQPLEGQRHLNVESLYDYGSRAGFWRLHRLFTAKHIKCTVFVAGMTLERNPEACAAMKEAKWEVASHGYRLMNYQGVDEKVEQEHMDRTIAIHQKVLGGAPAGIFLGRPSTNSRKLAARKFYYDSDSYSDDLPFWTLQNGSPHLVIPYTMTQNDMRFVTPGGFANGEQFNKFLMETLE